jgi:hypothetical protein
MPDISMCKNEDCPVKNNCYRFLAKPSFLQSYGLFIYNNGCESFWNMKG